MNTSTLFKFLLVVLIQGEASCANQVPKPAPKVPQSFSCGARAPVCAWKVFVDPKAINPGQGDRVELSNAHNNHDGTWSCRGKYTMQSCCSLPVRDKSRFAIEIWQKECPDPANIK
ncbi:hypothetical protein PGT21_019928 [Puccinia graminis f. sp. tritici]|uniref:Uncharacterized protein n=1 Tax=Puccinia graminis f. sp. tritici TaxID=56615 RepID=A0A5B0QG92_PUCGR|nr:hypothetical protein PGT21_019928 [Puccinia graminis f. sp. tritici]KAA1112165.1 hypothetical protein PGTUg99_013836 [Puccinia graminis f. sp. tritici]